MQLQVPRMAWRPSVWACTLLVAIGVQLNMVAGSTCNTAPDGGPWTTSSFGTCTGVNNGEMCYADCPAGSSGYKTITCQCSGTSCSFGNLVDSCVPETCLDNPPAGDDWTNDGHGPCTGVKGGETCYADCPAGFSGYKTITCQCSDASCSFGNLKDSCAPTTCLDNPPPGEVWTTPNGGACTGIADGKTCVADCSSGLTGYKSVTCSCDASSCSFGKVSDTCKSSTTCSNTPASGPWTTASGDPCIAAGNGENCFAECPAGVTGYKAITCSCDAKGCSFGSVTDTCGATTCDTPPAGTWTKTEGGGACTGVVSGSTCTAACPVAGSTGSKRITCSCTGGSCGFGPVDNTCQAPQTCGTLPVGFTWKDEANKACTAGASSGTKCTAACPSGQTGTKTTTCTCQGATCTWTEPSGACTPTPKPTCGALPAGFAWKDEASNDCAAGASSGTKCTAACPTGQTGTKVTTCTCQGATCTWTEPSGTCTAAPTCPASGPDAVADCGAFSGTGNSDKATRTCTCLYGDKPTITATCDTSGSTPAWKITSTIKTCPSAPAPTCSNTPTIDNGAFDPVTSARAVGDVINGKCKDGYEGTPQATCTKLTDTTAKFQVDATKKCTLKTTPTCTNQPEVTNGGFPIPTDKSLGAVVAGTCKDGYIGTPKATCTKVGELIYFVVQGSCEPKPCPSKCYTQPPSVDGIFWPYTCYGTDYVKARCHGRDYEPGWVEANCNCGEWEVAGTCKKIERPRCDDYCWSMPPNVEGIFWPSTCYGRRSYSAICQPGYYRDKVTAKCACGTWVVTGKCKKVEQPTCQEYCYGLPAAVEGVYWPNSCWGSQYFKGYCAAGYTGYVEAKCECGVWKTSGTCTKIGTELPKQETCYGKPKNKKYGSKWSWKSCHGKHSCKCKCRSGHKGNGYKATCRNGKWHVTGSCSSRRYTRYGWRH